MYRHACMTIFLATSCHGQKLGTEGIRLLARHLIEGRSRHRLAIESAGDNTIVIRAYERVGSRGVGIMRNYEHGPDGAWHDGLLMDMLQEELSP